jgi:hypothetical protein
VSVQVPIGVVSAGVGLRMSITLARSCSPMCMTPPPGFTAESAVSRVAFAPTASIA